MQMLLLVLVLVAALTVRHILRINKVVHHYALIWYNQIIFTGLSVRHFQVIADTRVLQKEIVMVNLLIAVVTDVVYFLGRRAANLLLPRQFVVVFRTRSIRLLFIHVKLVLVALRLRILNALCDTAHSLLLLRNGVI